MKISFKNSDLDQDTIESINKLVDMDINASCAFKLTKIIKEISSIIDSKSETEKKILTKYAEKDSNNEFIVPKNDLGETIEGTVSIKEVEKYTKEMSDLMNTDNELAYDQILFESLELKTAKIKDLFKISFLFADPN
jgi:hypothetical protein